MSIAAKCTCGKSITYCVGGDGCPNTGEPNKYWLDRIAKLEKSLKEILEICSDNESSMESLRRIEKIADTALTQPHLPDVSVSTDETKEDECQDELWKEMAAEISHSVFNPPYSFPYQNFKSKYTIIIKQLKQSIQ